MPDDWHSSSTFAPSMQANPAMSQEHRPMAGVGVIQCHYSTLPESLTLMGPTTCPLEGGRRMGDTTGNISEQTEPPRTSRSLKMMKMYLSDVTLKLPHHPTLHFPSLLCHAQWQRNTPFQHLVDVFRKVCSHKGEQENYDCLLILRNTPALLNFGTGHI